MPGLDYGFVHIYTGNGKGKTTAALGLIVRAVGYGLKTILIQFMKDHPYNELKVLDNLPKEIFTRFHFGNDDFVLKKNKPSSEDISKIHDGISLARHALSSGQYDLVILDEICVCPYFGLIDPEELMPLFKLRKENTEMVLTGRYCPEIWKNEADLISEVKEIKHYYNKGVLSREGIDS